MWKIVEELACRSVLIGGDAENLGSFGEIKKCGLEFVLTKFGKFNRIAVSAYYFSL